MIIRVPWLLIAGIFGLLLALLRFLVLLPFPRKVPPYAELRLRGPILWGPRAPLGRLRLRKRGSTVEGVERLLRELAKEPDIRGVLVTGEDFHGSRARLRAIQLALQGFRDTGREVVLYWKQGTPKDFALFPAADRILLAPGGSVLLVGHASTLTNIRGILDKIGILPDFFRIGPHKTAPELFTEKEPSEIQRRMVESVLDSRYERLVRLVAARRGGDEAWARAVIDGGPYTSRRALDAGLVDALVFPDEVQAFLNEPGGEEVVRDARSADAGKRRASSRRPSQSGGLPQAEAVVRSRKWRFQPRRILPGPRVAVIPISGLIKPGKSARVPSGRGFAGEETIVSQIDAARRDPKVRGVVVYADSRGGAAPASELMWRAVWRCAREKPTVGYVEEVAASGGYFAIAGANRIIAAPGALVGSIGVFAGRLDLRKVLSRMGIHQEVLTRGAHAGLLEPAHALGASEREALEAEIRQVYDDFVGRVAEGRGRSRDEIHSFGEGRVFVAENAPEALVDEVGDFRAALTWVAKEAGIGLEKAEVRVMQAKGGGLGAVPTLVRGSFDLGTMGTLLVCPLPVED